MCKEGELRSHGQMITKQLMTSLGQCVGITLSNCPPGAGKEFFYETLSKVSWCMLQILFEHVLYASPRTKYWNYIRKQKG